MDEHTWIWAQRRPRPPPAARPMGPGRRAEAVTDAWYHRPPHGTPVWAPVPRWEKGEAP